MIDLAIIGGGVSGCYCAYRLAHHSKLKSIQLFEASDRIGGRLWSQAIEGNVAGEPIEIGGQWFGKGQVGVYRLVTEALNLKRTSVEWNDKHWFLRNKYLTENDFKNSNSPYQLKDDECGKNPYQILDLAIERILTLSLSTLWPNSGTRNDTLRVLREVTRPDGRKLWQCGFWNLLAEVVSPEAYEFMLDGVGITSTFRNTNSYDAIALVLFEKSMGGGEYPYRLLNGYQSLPLELISQCGKRVKSYPQHTLTGVSRVKDRLVLRFTTPGDPLTIETKRVILALPRRALELIRMGHNVLDSKKFKDDLDSVLPVPACKLYLLFDQPWWTDPKLGPTGFNEENKVFASYTDLPMRQCYYFRNGYDSKPALLMACYADYEATSFWSVLAKKTDDEVAGPHVLALAGVPQGSKAMVEEARRQLSAMHGAKEVPVPNKPPQYWDWGQDPFGAAWHAWAPHCMSWEVRKRMRQPKASVPLYTCGEAFAEFQGWVEGAINSAEMALRQASIDANTPFNLSRPEWVTEKPEFDS